MTFIGSKQLGIHALRVLHEIASEHLDAVVTVNDRDDGQRSELLQFREFAGGTDTKLEVLDRPSQLQAVIDDMSPDLCLVVGWYWMIPPDVLEKVPQGFLGIHTSLLPKYRGGAPLVWAIINGEDESGVSLFYFDDGMDTGDLVGQESFAIGSDDTIATVLDRAAEAAEEVLRSTVPALLTGSAERWPQRHDDATYGALRRPEDGELDWSKSSIEVHNHIRAQTRPYPGAFTYLDGERVNVWKASPYEREYYGVPGQVVQVVDEGPVVTCGSGAVVLHETEPTRLKFGQRLGRG